MMKFIEQIGNIKVYAEKVEEDGDTFVDVMCMNGSTVILQDGRCITDTKKTESDVVGKVLQKSLNIYTEQQIKLQYSNPIKISDNTYRVGKRIVLEAILDKFF